MRYFLFSMTFLISQLAYGVIDTKNANYTNTFIDIVVPGTGYDLRVARTYNSRSLYNGLFAFGWCSDFETSLKKTGEGNILVTECGAGQQVIYSPGDSTKSLDAVVSKIMVEVRKRRGKTLTEDYYKKFEKDLYENVELRTTYAERLKLDADIKKDITYKANGSEVEEVVYNGKYYTRKLADSSSQRFDLEGRLTHVYDKNLNYLKISYSGPLIKEVVDNSGRKLTFFYDANKRLSKIVGPNELTATYKFSAGDDLEWVKNGWKNEYSYAYDDLHNLTKITYPDGTFVALTYNQKNDWVTSFTDREKCTEVYLYETSKEDPINHYWSTVTKTCGKDVVAKNRYEFWYKSKTDKSVYLHRVLTKVNKQETDITYHPEFGKPVSIRKNAARTAYQYYANGLVKSKRTSTDFMEFFYDTEINKVNKIVHSFFDDKGKLASQRTSEFAYNDKGNMRIAKNSTGQEIEIEYDSKGRMRKITDQAKKVVTLTYEERFGNPHVVTRAGLGSIVLNYDSNGEIEKVDSKQGPKVAGQIASTFSNLLDVIAPATAELYL